MSLFNPDGSLKLPGSMVKKREDDSRRLKIQRCIKIKRAVVNFTAPKKCNLNIQLSDAFRDNRFIDTIYKEFKQRASTPTSLNKINDKEFDITIETDFRRCTDCICLRNKYKDFLDGNVIDETGSCTFGGRKRSFSYDDYFD